MTCPTCHQPALSVKTTIIRGQLATGCPACLHTVSQGNELAAQNHRTYDQREHRKSNVQPVEIQEYIEAYPEQSRDIYDEATLRKYGH